MEDKYENLRMHYKPNKVKILFVGESVPSSGTFFYDKNSKLYFNTKEAFEKANIKFSLDKFKQLGCWLYDVCDVPVAKLSKKERKKKIKLGQNDLDKTIEKLNPEIVIVVKKGAMKELIFDEIIKNYFVDKKTAFNTPFPACSHENEYVDELSKILEKIFIQN